MRLIYLILAISFLGFRAAAEVECGGGDGPGPAILDISDSIVSGETSHRPLGGVQEIVVLENRETLVYRNLANELYAIDYGAGSGPSQLLTRHSPPLTRLTDRGETQLLARDSFNLFSLETFTWRHLIQPLVKVDHLFWNKKGEQELFSLERPTSRDRQEFTLYHWWARSDEVSSCIIHPSGNYEWRVVEGSTWPYVVLYREILEKHRRRILLHPYRRDCRPWFWPWQEIRIKESEHPPLQSIYQYPDTGKMVIKFDDPDGKNVYVTRGIGGRSDGDRDDPEPPPPEEPDHCEGYSLDNAPPVYLGGRDPVLAMQSGHGKVGLVYLNQKKQARLRVSLTQPGLDQGAVALTNDAKRLWLTVTGQDGNPEVRQIELNPEASGR